MAMAESLMCFAPPFSIYGVYFVALGMTKLLNSVIIGKVLRPLIHLTILTYDIGEGLIQPRLVWLGSQLWGHISHVMLSPTSLAHVSARCVEQLKTVVITVFCIVLEQRTFASNGIFIKLWENFRSIQSRMAYSLRSRTSGFFMPLWTLSLCQKAFGVKMLNVLIFLLMDHVCTLSTLPWGSRLGR